MEFQKYSFTPSLFGTFITVTFITLFISLAVWQWHRAEYKTQLVQMQLEQGHKPPLQIGAEKIDWPAGRFHRVEVHGMFDHEHEILLDNVVRKGQAGYSVLTPLLLSGTQQHVLVDRGWVGTGNDRSVLPEIKHYKQEVTLQGVLDMPHAKPAFVSDSYQPDHEGTKRWAFMDMDYLKQKLPYALQPYVVVQTSMLDDGLQRAAPRVRNKAGMHIGYSIQWAAFALIAFIAYITINTRKKGKDAA